MYCRDSGFVREGHTDVVDLVSCSWVIVRETDIQAAKRSRSFSDGDMPGFVGSVHSNWVGMGFWEVGEEEEGRVGRVLRVESGAEKKQKKDAAAAAAALGAGRGSVGKNARDDCEIEEKKRLAAGLAIVGCDKGARIESRLVVEEEG